MSGLVKNLGNLGRKINKYDPLDRAVQNFVIGKPKAGRNYYGEPAVVPPAPPAPTIGAAQLGADQQDEFQRRRRGVLANLYGGGSGNASGGNASGGGATLLGQ